MIIRLYGAGIVLTSALTLALNITLNGPFALVCSTTIAAGTYDIFSFAAKVNEALRIDIRAKAITAGVDTVPAAANVLFKFVFPAVWSDTPGANIINCTFDCTGFLEGGVQRTLSVFTLNNTSGWCTKLGLSLESTTTVTSVIVNPVGTVTGTHQAEAIFCLQNSTQDTWDNEIRPFESTIHLGNGKVRGWSRGVAEANRTITITDLPADVAGPPLDAKTYSAFNGANRGKLVFVNADESGLTNIPDINTNITLVAGDLVRIGNDDFFSRVTALSATEITTGRYWPATIVPTAGDSIWQISEAHALWIEAYRTKYFFVFEPDESANGTSKFKALAYKLNLEGRVETNFIRRDMWLSLYSVTFNLTRRDTPETVVV